MPHAYKTLFWKSTILWSTHRSYQQKKRKAIIEYELFKLSLVGWTYFWFREGIGLAPATNPSVNLPDYHL